MFGLLNQMVVMKKQQSILTELTSCFAVVQMLFLLGCFLLFPAFCNMSQTTTHSREFPITAKSLGGQFMTAPGCDYLL